MVLLVEWFSVVLAIAELPLAVLFLLDVIVQSDGLIKQGLVVGCISYRQGYLQFTSKSIEKLLFPLDISVNILWGIPSQGTEIIHVLLQSPSSLPQTAEFILLQIHNARRDMGSTKAFLECLLV